ncbi:MAG: phosphoglucomutase/phosphomannomutase family protein [bacterium]|nr:MAG: phosphoglucomutase/phosphomannomutase family protein [bacterium]
MVKKGREDAGSGGDALKEIRFGTSGWRGIIADDFTFERSRLVVAAIARYMRDSGEAQRGVLVGHDTRFLAEEFASDAAALLADMGIDVLLCSSPVPTPAIASVILGRGLGGALNFTASHNPSIYQGIKFSPSWGGPALPQTTGAIEDHVAAFQRDGLPAGPGVRGRIEPFDPAPQYLSQLAGVIDLKRIARSGTRIVYDALYGTGAGFLDRVLSEAGCDVRTLHAERDPLFGGGPPEPSADRLGELARLAEAESAVGLSTDGDADRFGVVGSLGEYYEPNVVLSLLAEYLLDKRGMEGDLARSVATTGMLDLIAAFHGRQCHETPVGFKYIGQMISRNQLAMGGEESAGMSIRGHVPEKDGILACLLVAEMVAATGKSMAELKSDLDRRYGTMYSVRVNLQLNDDLAGRLRSILRSPPERVGELGAGKLLSVDGTKWIYDGGDWVLLRLSGTEPVARLYVESADKDRFEALKSAFSRWITGEEAGEEG